MSSANSTLVGHHPIDGAELTLTVKDAGTSISQMPVFSGAARSGILQQEAGRKKVMGTLRGDL